MTFGEKLYRLRTERGMSQEMLARSLGVSRQAISRWELGEVVPDTANVLAVSRKFGASTDCRGTGADKKTEPPSGGSFPFPAYHGRRGGETLRFFRTYDRLAAVLYAHRWAYGRNPKYYDYDSLGGDCTNFASQCIFAGSGVMNFTPTYGWYYLDANQKAPAWTGVEYLWNFLTRKTLSVGPVGEPCGLSELLPGDIVQLSFTGEGWQHCPVVVAVGAAPGLDSVLVAAHSHDADFRPLSTYSFRDVRFLHITGTVGG